MMMPEAHIKEESSEDVHNHGGQGAKEEGQGVKEKGQGAKEERHRAKEKGQGVKEEGGRIGREQFAQEFFRFV